MTRDELIEALMVERFGPPIEPDAEPKPVVFDDSELTTVRRRRELDAALEGFEDYRLTSDGGI